MHLLLLLLVPLAVFAQRRDRLEFFETNVRPVLVKNCAGCHGAAGQGGLEMTSRDSLLKGGKSGPAIDVERPEESLLVKAITHKHERLKMPPGGKLAEEEIKNVVAWIGRGAVWPPSAAAKKTGEYKITPEQRNWWAFQPVKKPAPPAVKAASWAKTPVDRLLLAAMEAKGLRPVAAASKREWLRRATIDLTGLPPTASEMEAFEKDASSEARGRVVDRLLASRHFGERWGRFWLDVARYSDDLLNSTQDQPYENAFRYRDWVIQALNDDMPYDTFVKAQLAGDLAPAGQKKKLIGGLGFFGLSPQFQDDRVEVTGKAFLGLTVACAQCHDHKFDPIPTKDYYSMLGVFTSTENTEYPLAPEPEVKLYRDRKKAIDQQQEKLDKFLEDQAKQLAEILANRTADYLRAARRVLGPEKADAKQTAAAMKLDGETLERWTKYLAGEKEHPFLARWESEERFPAAAFQDQVLQVLKDQREIEEKNFIRLGGSNERGNLAGADLLSLPRDRWVLYRDVFTRTLFYKTPQIDRFLEGQWNQHLANLRSELDARKKVLPEQYPFLHVIHDKAKPRNERVRIRGSADNLGDEVPRHFLTILSAGDPEAFRQGSGRQELAEAIANPGNPLTSRVIVNRMWHHLFGTGLVRTLSNFGVLGEKPSHPELLDYLAARLVEEKWSLKALLRELTLTNAYALSHRNDEKSFEVDPENRLLWRATRRKMDIESLRDALLASTGELDAAMGGKPLQVADEKNLRRTVYSFVSRRKLDGTLALFDFPNPNSMAEQRIPTSTPLQQLFFLNSGFVDARARAFAAKMEREAAEDGARIRHAYRQLYLRDPDKAELEAGLAFLKSDTKAWPKYAQALLSSNEFFFY